MCELRVGPGAEFRTGFDGADGTGISWINKLFTFLIECKEKQTEVYEEKNIRNKRWKEKTCACLMGGQDCSVK